MERVPFSKRRSWCRPSSHQLLRGKAVTTIKHAWIYALKRAGISRRIRPYELRHAFGTELVAAGVDIGTVAHLMGHSSPQMLLKHYLYVLDKSKVNAVEKLPLPNLNVPHGTFDEKGATVN